MNRYLLSFGVLLVLVLGGFIVYLLLLPPPPPEAKAVEQLATEMKQAPTPPDITPEFEKLIQTYEQAPEEAREPTLLRLVLEEPPTDLTPLLARIRTLEDVEQRRMLEKVLVRTWAMDQESTVPALEYAQQIGDEELAEVLVKAIVGDWAQRNLPTAQAYVVAMASEEPYRTDAMLALTEELAKASPREAYDLISTHTADPLRAEWQFALFPLLAKVDPVGAAEAYLNFPTDERQKQAMAALVDAWRPVDQTALLDWLKALPEDKKEMQELGYTITLVKWAEEDPQQAGEFIHTLPAGPLQTNMAGMVARPWGAKNGRQALVWVDKFSDPALKIPTAIAIFSSWAEVDPVGAAQYAGMLTDGPLRDAAFGVIAPFLAEKDIQDAADWVSVLPGNTPGRLDAVEGLTTVWLKEGGEPADIYRYVRTRLPKAVRTPALGRFYRAWARQDVAAAAKSAAKLPEGKARLAVVPEVYATWAVKDAPAAAAGAAAMPPSELRRAAFRGVARNWVQQDRPAALNWAEGLESDADQTAVQEVILEEWMRESPADVLAWLQQKPEGKGRDALVAASAERLVVVDASGTIELVEAIQDKKRRGQVLAKAAAAWRATSPGPAKAWIEQSDLPTKTKNQLLELE